MNTIIMENITKLNDDDGWDNWRRVITELAQGKQLLFFPNINEKKSTE